MYFRKYEFHRRSFSPYRMYHFWTGVILLIISFVLVFFYPEYYIYTTIVSLFGIWLCIDDYL